MSPVHKKERPNSVSDFPFVSLYDDSQPMSVHFPKPTSCKPDLNIHHL